MAGVSGGDKLEAYLQGIEKKMSSSPELRVGFLEEPKYPDGTPVAQVAFWNEYGTEKSPPRPFFRQIISSRGQGWGASLAAGLRATNMDVARSMELVGEQIKDDIVGSIVAFSDPENADYTVAKKGFNKPLIDSGLMQRSVDYSLQKGGVEGEAPGFLQSVFSTIKKVLRWW